MSRISRRTFLGGSLALLGAACTGSSGASRSGSVSPGAGGDAARPLPATGDVFGYEQRFGEALGRIGEIAPGELGTPPAYLADIGFDPTKARYLAETEGAGLGLDARESKRFRNNGFVVSGRLAGSSFGEQYYRIFTADLPVFISADSVLHAWHRSYDAVLEELETSYLIATVGDILDAMSAALPGARSAYGDGWLGQSVADADYFLAVARSLLAGAPAPSKLGDGAVERRVSETRAAVQTLALSRFELFGAPRVVDFSQFKVRGHYANSAALGQYFQAMMWLGRIDLRVAGDPDDADGRQLASAAVLHDLLVRAGRESQWRELDRLLQTFIGRTDSMTFAELGGLLAAARIASPAALSAPEVVKRLRADIEAQKLGLQQIRSDYLESSPYGPDKVALPRSFTVMGQKFTVDSWATAKLVADDILWKGGKVQRRMPSALDVAYAVLGNDAALPTLVARIENPQGVAFRDGLPVQHNLKAVREVVDGHAAKDWEGNLYMGWLATLRALSAPTTDERYPAVMRTSAWAARTLNTQLASWAELRHDTLLYVKQSYTVGVTCFHPAGFVDGPPAFWTAFAAMARRAGTLLRQTPVPGGGSLERPAAFFEAFAARIDALGAIAQKQLERAALTEAEAKLLKDVIQVSHGSGFTRYDGWYPTLFYKGADESGKADELVADVHTDVPAPAVGDPGGVLHQGVGRVDLLVMAVECGGDTIAYLGPTASHYELATVGVSRLDDAAWKQMLQEGKAPPRPEWTQSYLVG